MTTKPEPTPPRPVWNATPAGPGPTPLTATCHCGRVSVTFPTAPAKINECRCSVCYKYGALWAYYPRGDITVTAADGAKTVAYIRTDPGADGDISFNRCSECGCMTHWWGEGAYAGADHKMGVNCRMLPEKDIEGIVRKVSYC
jgi:hypothetical protein